jgi:hypothetical protein
MADGLSFIAACIGIQVASDDSVIEAGDYRVHKRLWRHDTFDVHTLGAHHQVNFSYTLLDVFWNHVMIELEPIAATDIDDAKERLSVYRSMLYLNGVNPFFMPFITNHSVNAIAGINRRDGNRFDDQFPQELRTGITSKTAKIEAWPHEMTFRLIGRMGAQQVTPEIAGRANWQAQQWIALERKHPELSAVRHALETAPTISHIGSSLLHIWTGLESLFPSLHTEVSFRVALLLAELASPVRAATETYEIARRSYGHRSKAAHGNLKRLGNAEWTEAWQLLCTCMTAVIKRRELPDESELVSGLLTKQIPISSAP